MTPQHPFYLGFVEVLLVCGIPTDGPDPDTSLGISDLAPETERQLLDECADFLDRTATILEGLGVDLNEAGGDFFYTREGHGVGFWDRGHGEHGELLSQIAQQYTACEPYLGDDGLIYIVPPRQRPALPDIALFRKHVPQSPRYLW